MNFVRIANFNNKLQAETTAHLLDEASIPFTIHSDESIFGEGGVSQYVFLSVPAEFEEKARALIADATGGGEVI
jgi:hypothetical protein